MTRELIEETVRKWWVLIDNLHLPGVSFLEAWARSHPDALCGPYTQMRHSPRCAGSGEEGYSTTTSQGWPQSKEQQVLVLRTQLQLQALGRWRGLSQCFLGPLRPEVEHPPPPRTLPAWVQGGSYDGIFKRCARDQSPLRVSLPWTYLQARNTHQLLGWFSAEKRVTDRQSTQSPRTPRPRPVNARDLLVTQTCCSSLVPSWKLHGKLTQMSIPANIHLSTASVSDLILSPALSLHGTHDNVLKMCMFHKITLIKPQDLIHTLTEHLFNGRHWTDTGLQQQMVPSPKSRKHSPTPQNSSVLLVIPYQRSICIPLLTHLFPSVLALKIFPWKSLVWLTNLSGFIWSISKSFEMEFERASRYLMKYVSRL